MSRRLDYARDLMPLFDGIVKGEHRDRLEIFLVAHSRLPGPRGNLELAAAFADTVAAAAGPGSGLLWGLLCGLSSESVETAPVNDPREFLAFCGVLGIGALAGVDERFRRGALSKLRARANDSRWRTREAVAMGLQRLLAAAPQEVVAEIADWVRPDNWLEMRAVAAGIAEPGLLTEETLSRAALDVHRRIMDQVLLCKTRGTEEFLTLRKGLGYTLSVVVAALPGPGFDYLRELAGTENRDILWILKNNLKKKRLTRDFPEEIERLKLE